MRHNHQCPFLAKPLALSRSRNVTNRLSCECLPCGTLSSTVLTAAASPRSATARQRLRPQHGHLFFSMRGRAAAEHTACPSFQASRDRKRHSSAHRQQSQRQAQRPAACLGPSPQAAHAWNGLHGRPRHGPTRRHREAMHHQLSRHHRSSASYKSIGTHNPASFREDTTLPPDASGPRSSLRPATASPPPRRPAIVSSQQPAIHRHQIISIAHRHPHPTIPASARTASCRPTRVALARPLRLAAASPSLHRLIPAARHPSSSPQAIAHRH